MNSKAMSLKARIRNYAKDNRIAAQVVLQNYMGCCMDCRNRIDRWEAIQENKSIMAHQGSLLPAMHGR